MTRGKQLCQTLAWVETHAALWRSCTPTRELNSVTAGPKAAQDESGKPKKTPHVASHELGTIVGANVLRAAGLVGSASRHSIIEPGSPWENGYCESFNSKLRDELLAGEQFSTLLEGQVLIERWRRHYNTVRPHSALGYRPPAPRRSCRSVWTLT